MRDARLHSRDVERDVRELGALLGEVVADLSTAGAFSRPADSYARHTDTLACLNGYHRSRGRRDSLNL